MNKTLVSADYQVEYLYQDRKKKKTILLFHGYMQSAKLINKLIGHIFPSDYNILIPNGPFPIPRKRQDTHELSYAWYFYDAKTDHYYIDYSIPTKVITGLCEELGILDHEFTVIGYSQGGYLAPFVAEKLSNVSSVIALNASFRVDMMSGNRNYKVHGINSKNDKDVDPLQALKRHQELSKWDMQGEFHLIESEGHKLTSEFFSPLLKFL